MEPILRGSDRFGIDQLISHTQQGEVRGGRDISKNCFCVIKKVYKRCITNNRTFSNLHCDKNFHNEKAILYYLTRLSQTGNNHGSYYNTNGITKIHDEWEDNTCLYYAMEYCKKGSLDSFVAKQFGDQNSDLQKLANKCVNAPANKILSVKPAGCYSPWLKMVRDVFQQLASTVSWMHRNGVCHLDLSLDNVMISDIRPSDGIKKLTVKIIDFGVAKYFGNENLIDENKKYNDKKNQTFTIYKDIISRIK